MAVNFYLEGRLSKSGDAPVRVRISVLGASFMTTTGVKIPPAKWDARRQCMRRGGATADGIPWNAVNAWLARIVEHFRAYENNFMINGGRPSAQDIKAEFLNEFRGRVGQGAVEEQNGRFWAAFRQFVKERSEANSWTDATMAKFAALKNHLSAYKEFIGFNDIDEGWLSGWAVFLRERRNLKNSTIGKQFGFLRWFLRWAVAKGLTDNKAFETFSPKLKTAQRRVVFLTWAELMKVYRYDVPPTGTEVDLVDAAGRRYRKTVMRSEGLAVARDVFCFCCFTSLRYSDAQNLKRADICDGVMSITTVKTADSIMIELNKYAAEVLRRWEAAPLGGYALPRITNQRMNMYLKDLCELCGINEPVTQTYYRGAERIDQTRPKYEMIGTHTGRRTFICNALALGIAPQIVMKWTGHADYASMKPYIDIADDQRASAMGRFDAL